MNKSILIIVVLVLILIAFFVGYSININDGRTNSYSSKTSCETIGGKWGVFFNSPFSVEECNLPTSDAGEECTDSTQCESYCQAPTGSGVGSSVSGTCHGFIYSLDGCSQSVEKGIVQHELCQ